MPHRRTLAALSLAAALAIAGGAAADPPRGAAAWLDRADAEWKDLEYARVVDAAGRALASPGVTRDQRVRALELRGSALVVLGREADAIAAFEQLFGLAPDHRLPENTSPRIRAVYEPARTRWEVARESALRDRLGADLAAMKMAPALPRAGRGGLTLTIPVRLTDPKKLTAEVVVYYRRVPARSFSRVSARASGGDLEIDLPGAITASPRAYRLELYVEALHASGVALRRAGTRAEPLAIEMSAGSVPRPTPIYRRWWFWAGVAATAIAVPFLVDQAIDVGPQTVTGRPR